MSVYFIAARELGTCKIGVAGNVKARHSTLQTSSPVKLTLEAVLPGSRELERKLHKRFAKHRVSGEWFTITEELDALIAEAASSPVLAFPTDRIKDKRASDKESVEASIALHRRMLAEAMEDFERRGTVPRPHPPEPDRFYRPVAVSGGQFAQHYAIRGEGDHRQRLFCVDLKLSWDQADHLCDVLEQVREYALQEGVEA